MLQFQECAPYPADHSVIVLDNWRGHKSVEFVDACDELGIIIEYGVPYAPDLMVHEPCGGAAKQLMRKEGKEWRREGLDYRSQIEISLMSVAPATVRSACHRMGYENFSL